MNSHLNGLVKEFIFQWKLEPEFVESLWTLLDSVWQEGFDEGDTHGFDEGRASGYTDGYEDGRADSNSY